MSYQPIFDPVALAEKRPPPAGVAYLYDSDTQLAVNVALATGRPLLLSGDPGCGKSTLAADVARLLDRRFEPKVITSRMQGQDLKWRFDTVRRLADVQAIRPGDPVHLDDRKYVEPGVLWRAFDPASAATYGAAPAMRADKRQEVVVLLDEMDKADPDLPNNLLVAVDERWFTVDDGGFEVRAPEALNFLLVITTNGERDLPQAFIRRCVSYRMPNPKGDRVKDIARRHFPEASDAFLEHVRATMDQMATAAAKERRREPSVAEYLDAVRALTALELTEDPQSPDWLRIAEATMLKADRPVASRA